LEQWATALWKELPCLNVQPLGLSNKLQVQAACHCNILVKSSKKLHPIGQVLSKSKNNTTSINFQKKTPGINTSKLPPALEILQGQMPITVIHHTPPSSTMEHLENLDACRFAAWHPDSSHIDLPEVTWVSQSARMQV